MKTKFLLAWLAAALVFVSGPAFAADSNAKADLQALVGKINNKIQQGQATAAALAGELAEFDALRAKYKGDKSDDSAQIVVMHAALYAQVLDDDEKALVLLGQLKADFAGTASAGRADQMIAGIKRMQEVNQVQRALAVGSVFPEFAEPALDGHMLSLASFKGKVVLIDFWATWCGPCIAELPNVLGAYQKHHAAGFEIVGISLDGADARDKLTSFIKQQNMPWAQICDGEGWQGKLVVKHGVNSIPATYLLDAEGKIVAKNLRGPALEKEVARLLAKRQG